MNTDPNILLRCFLHGGFYYTITDFKKSSNPQIQEQISKEAFILAKRIANDEKQIEIICDEIRDEQSFGMNVKDIDSIPEVIDYYIQLLSIVDFAKLYYKNLKTYKDERETYDKTFSQFLKLPKRTNSKC